jgi:uncharacterized sulfatase
VWKELYDQGRLSPPQTYFWETKPAEELYDLQNDPDEVVNLAESAAHQQMLGQLRQAQQDLAKRIRDVGFLPEGEIHSRSADSTPYEMGHDPDKYPLDRIMATAELASLLQTDATSSLKAALKDADSAVRYWAAMGLLMRGEEPVTAARAQLRAALNDSAPSVRVIAAQALGQYGGKADVEAALELLLDHARVDNHGVFTSMLALNALDAMDERAQSAKDVIAALPTVDDSIPQRMKAYLANLIKKTVSDLNQ